MRKKFRTVSLEKSKLELDLIAVIRYLQGCQVEEAVDLIGLAPENKARRKNKWMV